MFPGRLRRALDLKVRKLRTMLTADEDISTELDRVVCRLMKLTLRSSKGRQTPPPSRWMQCKLLDMLTLTEKAIERRQRYFIENYPLKKLDYDEHKRVENILALDKIKADNTANVIVDKYQHLVQPSVDKDTDKSLAHDFVYLDLDLADVNKSTELLKELKFIDVIKQSPPQVMVKETAYEVNLLEDGKGTKLERTQAWVEEDIEVVPYPNHDIKYENSSGDTDHSTSNAIRHKYKKNSKRQKIVSTLKKSDSKLHKHSQYKMQYDKYDKNKPEENNRDKAKTSKTKINKKECRKKSSYNNLFRNSQRVVSVEYGYGVRNRRTKEYVNEKPTVSKPIPETLKELCRPESIIEKNIEKSPSVLTEDIENDRIIPSSNIATTEKSFLIDIVTDELEETIAMRRSIGTDAEDSTLVGETIIRSISAVNVYSCCGNLEIPSDENIRSQTIFLYDINEPTTSKGIRHTSMDVQCGPDVTVPTYSVLSATTSQTKIPKIFTTGIKIGDSFTDIRLNQSEFGTSTNDSDTFYKTISPRVKSTGIRIKDSDTHLSYNVAYSTVTTTISASQMTSFNVQDFSSVTETALLKPVSSCLRIEDLGSETCEGILSLLHFADNSKNTSDIQSMRNEAAIVEKVTATKYGTSKLSCGGVHVHSYRDKDISEDIVYQGEWQRYRSKALLRRKPYIPMVMKKVTVAESVNKKLRIQSIKTSIPEKNSSKKKEVSSKCGQQKKPIVLSNNRLIKIKQEIGYKSDKNIKPEVPKKLLQSTVKINKPAKNISKVATKLTIRTLTSKNTNSTFSAKKTPISITSNKNNDKLEQPEKHIRKNYLPQYLRRNKSLSPIRIKYNLNQNTVNQENKEKQSHKPLLERSKTEEISTDLLKFRKELGKTVDYFVFRNELENKNSTSDDESPGNRDNAMGANSTLKPPYSFQSQTSSTCSSPNSIATVRAVTTRSKISSNKRHSAPNKNNLTSESENSTPNRNKKFFKRCQNAKRSDKSFDNKENIPESSGKAGKGVFMGRNKRIFMTQLATDSSPLQSAINSVSKHKTHVSNKSNIKIPTFDSNDQIKITSPSISKQRSRKSNLSSTADDSNYVESKSLTNSLNNSNLVLVVEQLQAEMVVAERHKESVILTSAIESSSADDNSILAQWRDDKNVSDNQTSNIWISMRQLIEETLEFIDASDNFSINPETSILSREDIKSASLNIISSPTSFKTVIPNEEEYNYIESINEIEALNRTFDTTSGDESIFSFAATEPKLIANDLDQLSFKSLATASKLSEYFLADSELNNFQVLPLSSRNLSPKTTSVKDIFERKDQFLSQNPGGTFANQAFSGFSIDGEPVAGDQLDHVNLIDSETGSMAVEVTRQATSEELFVSGRSSGSFGSCTIDEDAVVPYWLFQVISQQQSVDEDLVPSELEGPLPVALALPMPMEEPMFDENGNIMDGVAVGAGAGDGRGMHSDHSQDSSGRGTSLSSSDMSSGPQSEAILIDPSAFAAQFELLREPGGGSMIVPTNPADFQSPGVRNEHETLSSSRAEPIRNPRLLRVAAASDADISSTDTDVPDSSSN